VGIAGAYPDPAPVGHSGVDPELESRKAEPGGCPQV